MSVHVSSVVWKLRDITATQKLVLLFLADKANDDGVCWPGRTTIADECCLTARTVITATNELVAKGYLRVEHDPSDRYGTNVYHLQVSRGEIPSSLDSGMKETTFRGEIDDRSGVKELHPKHQKNRQGTNARARAKATPDTRWTPPAGPVPTAIPDETRCRHRNTRVECGACNPGTPVPPPPDLRAGLPPPRPGRKGHSYAPKAAS
jgi:DNA-binding MarR family transcriptional regulator